MGKQIIEGIQTGKNYLLAANAMNQDIRLGLQGKIKHAAAQAKAAGYPQKFEGQNSLETCRNIWNHLKHNIKYIEDNNLFQNIKSPVRLSKTGYGDCKSFSLFTAAILKNLGIPCFLKYVSYNNVKIPSHVYVVTQDGIIIDGVWTRFNQEKPYTYYQLFKV